MSHKNGAITMLNAAHASKSCTIIDAGLLFDNSGRAGVYGLASSKMLKFFRNKYCAIFDYPLYLLSSLPFIVL